MAYGRLLRRVFGNPADQLVVVGATGVSHWQAGVEARACDWPGAVVLAGWFAKQRACHDVGEVDAPAQFGVEPAVVGGCVSGTGTVVVGEPDGRNGGAPQAGASRLGGLVAIRTSTCSAPWVPKGLVPVRVPRISLRVADTTVALSGMVVVSKERTDLYW